MGPFQCLVLVYGETDNFVLRNRPVTKPTYVSSCCSKAVASKIDLKMTTITAHPLASVSGIIRTVTESFTLALPDSSKKVILWLVYTLTFEHGKKAECQFRRNSLF